MNRLLILNTSEEKRDVIKTYVPKDGKIGEITVDDSNIYVKLVNIDEERLIPCGVDTIMNREAEPANGVKLRTSVTDLKQTQIVINMKEMKKEHAVKIIAPRHVLLETPRVVEIDVNTDGYYYAYARGKVLLATKDAGEAVRCANENYGVVVDDNLKYIFKRARNTTQTAFSNLTTNEADSKESSLVQAISIILTREGVGISVSELMGTGQTPLHIMQTTLKGSTVLNLRNCTIDETLFFIDQGTPVLVRIGADEAVLLVGYSSSQISYYNPSTKQTYTVGYDDFMKDLENSGYYFVAYVK
jgi:hypothetical protein